MTYLQQNELSGRVIFPDVVSLPIGILGSLFGAYMLMKSSNGRDADMMIGMALIILFAPFSTAGYLGLIAKWVSGPMTALKIFMARGGTSTLTGSGCLVNLAPLAVSQLLFSWLYSQSPLPAFGAKGLNVAPWNIYCGHGHIWENHRKPEIPA